MENKTVKYPYFSNTNMFPIPNNSFSLFLISTFKFSSISCYFLHLSLLPVISPDSSLFLCAVGFTDCVPVFNKNTSPGEHPRLGLWKLNHQSGCCVASLKWEMTIILHSVVDARFPVAAANWPNRHLGKRASAQGVPRDHRAISPRKTNKREVRLEERKRTEGMCCLICHPDNTFASPFCKQLATL